MLGGALPSLDLNFGFDDVGSSPEGLPSLFPFSNSAETAPLKLRTHGLWYRAAEPPHGDGWLVLGRLSCHLGCQAQGLGMCYLLFQGKEGGQGGTQNHNGRGGKKGGGQKGRKAAISSSPLVKQPGKRNQRKGRRRLLRSKKLCSTHCTDLFPSSSLPPPWTSSLSVPCSQH